MRTPRDAAHIRQDFRRRVNSTFAYAAAYCAVFAFTCDTARIDVTRGRIYRTADSQSYYIVVLNRTEQSGIFPVADVQPGDAVPIPIEGAVINAFAFAADGRPIRVFQINVIRQLCTDISVLRFAVRPVDDIGELEKLLLRADQIGILLGARAAQRSDAALRLILRKRRQRSRRNAQQRRKQHRDQSLTFLFHG